MSNTLASSVLVSCAVWFVALGSCGPSVVVDRNVESDGGRSGTDARSFQTPRGGGRSTAAEPGGTSGEADGGADASAVPGGGASEMPEAGALDGGSRVGSADTGSGSRPDSRSTPAGSEAGGEVEPNTKLPDEPSDVADGGPAPPGAVHPEAPSDWLGAWSGTASYTDVVRTDPFTGMVHREEKQISISVQVDDFDREGAAEGWAVIVGRMSSSECVLSAAFSAMVFFGDSISHPAFPVVSASGGGVDQAGRMVGFSFSGERRLDSLQGKVSFDSESQRQPPCDSRELAFTLVRAR